MKPGFINETLDVRTGNGLDDVLLEPLDYVRPNGDVLRAPIGGTTDGLSVPRAVQNIIPATGGDWFSGVIHDSAYRNQLLILPAKAIPETGIPDGNMLFVLARLNQEQCDNLILEAMESQGVGWLMRHVIYRALRMFGAVAFSEDRVKALH